MLLASVAALALTSATGFAQETTAPAATEQTEVQAADAAKATSGVTVLDQVTVVSRTGETAIDTMASVSHVDQEQLDRRMAVTVGDTVFGVPGVTAQTDNKRVGTSFNVRGLQDSSTVRARISSALAMAPNPSRLSTLNCWRRSIRGPVANTYGSGAIGGVVVMETKDAVDFLRPDETWATSFTGRYDSNGDGWTTSATGAYRFNEAFDVLGNVVYRNFNDYEDGDGDTVEGTGFEVMSGILKSTIRPTDTSELKLGWIGANDSWEEGSGAYDVDVNQNTFTARYQVTDEDTSWLDLHINAAYNGAKLDQTYQRDVFRFSSVTGLPVLIPEGSKTGYDLGTTGIDIWNTSRFETGEVAHELTYGGDWVTDDVETSSPEGGDDLFTPSGKRRVSGAYIQDKLTYGWLEIVGALRYDSYKLDDDVNEDVSGDRLSPRITVGVSPFESIGLEGLQIYGTYAEGYRSPSLSETLISGLHPNGVVFPFLPNPDLKPETGKTWEMGINYANEGIFQADDKFRLKAAYYNNDIDDYIGGTTLSPFDPTSGCPFIPGPSAIPICFQYQNYASAEIKGFELEGVYDAAWGFAGLTVSLIDGHTVSYDGVREDLVTIPSSQVTGQIGFRFLEDKLTLGGEVQYNGAPEGNELAEDYTLVNLFASYQATEDFRVDFRADNLFDAQYVNPLNGSTTEPLYEPGISLKLGATMRFGG